MTLKRTMIVLALGSALAGCADSEKHPATTQPVMAVSNVPVNKLCPVTSDPIDPKITYVYDGKTYGFCCADCIVEFKKNPAKYAANAK